MTDNIALTIYAVAQTDPETSREKLAALRALCAIPDTSRNRLAAIMEAIQHPPATPRRLVRTMEACRIIGGRDTPACTATLLRLVRAGQLRRYGLPHRPRYDVAELEALVARRATRSAEEERA